MFTTANIIEVIEKSLASIIEHKEMLTDLDIAIGDGDHGINMARGAEEVQKKLESLADKDAGTIIKSVGMTLVSTVGGASGPLYGTALMKAAAVVADKNSIDAADGIAMLDAAIEGIKMRGKSTAGEKTMLDALIPALEVLKNAPENEISATFDKALKAAEEGVEYTKTIIATKGRASYLGERSLGHQDPGATSSVFILQALATVLKEK